MITILFHLCFTARIITITITINLRLSMCITITNTITWLSITITISSSVFKLSVTIIYYYYPMSDSHTHLQHAHVKILHDNELLSLSQLENHWPHPSWIINELKHCASQAIILRNPLLQFLYPPLCNTHVLCSTFEVQSTSLTKYTVVSDSI